MGELIELAISRRSKTGYNFGPATLRGKAVAAPDTSLTHLTARQRVERILATRWATVSEVSDLADVEAYHVRQICGLLVREDLLDKRPHPLIQKTFEYQLKPQCKNSDVYIDSLRRLRYNAGTPPYGPSAA